MSGFSNFLNSSAGSAAFGSVGNIIGSYLGASNQWKYQQRQNEWSERMMQQQNAWNQQNAATAYQRQIAFYNMQNEYNSPLNQIARLRSAGINPNLAYANGALNNVAASTPSVSQAESASGAIFGVVAAFSTLFPDAKLMFMFIPFPIKAKYLLPIIIVISL